MGKKLTEALFPDIRKRGEKETENKEKGGCKTTNCN